MTQKAPALFIGHGSPMNAIEDTPASRGWREIATAFPKPRAIVSISAHWITAGVRVTSNARPRTIHDFGGFPPELFAVQYPALGDPTLAADIASRLKVFGAETDETWGLDHGTWSVLAHMYPEADVPVVQLSLDASRPSEAHYAIGQALAPLREEGVLILGSGDIVHNLRAFFQRGGANLEAEERQFDDDIVNATLTGEYESVLAYRRHPQAAHAAPDWDHFFPLFYTLAAGSQGEPARVFNRHYFPGISMTSIAFGVPQ
jgi:4,5-DOPA dioxygenase extradiol